MVAYQQGQLSAFDRLYGQLAPQLRSYLGSLVRDPARTADLVQETFLQLHRLRNAIAGELGPVPSLAPPHIRVLWVLPIALVLLILAPAVFSLRADTARLGLLLSWGVSCLETLIGLGVIATALRESVPGTLVSRRAIAWVSATAITSVAVITLITWRVSPTPLLQNGLGFVWRVCVAGTFVSALPALAISLTLVRRAFPLRPALAGGMCGLGAGLLADSGWRMFCHFTDPGHVFGAHLLAIALTTAAGALLGELEAGSSELKAP